MELDSERFEELLEKFGDFMDSNPKYVNAQIDLALAKQYLQHYQWLVKQEEKKIARITKRIEKLKKDLR